MKRARNTLMATALAVTVSTVGITWLAIERGAPGAGGGHAHGEDGGHGHGDSDGAGHGEDAHPDTDGHDDAGHEEAEPHVVAHPQRGAVESAPAPPPEARGGNDAHAAEVAGPVADPAPAPADPGAKAPVSPPVKKHGKKGHPH